MDLTAGLWQNLGEISLNMAANSLLVTPAGFNPATAFGSYNSQGLAYTPGTTLTVPAGKGFAGTYSFNDPVVCQGTITAANGVINLNNGLTASGNAVVNLGGGNLKSSVTVSGNASVTLGNSSVASGSLTVNDSASGISGGLLSTYNTYLGNNGAGTFTQTGGTNTASNNFYFGYNSGDVGTYNLTGGLLSAPTGWYSNATGSEYVGYSGTGTITQSGGTNAVTSFLALGYNSGAKGTYNMIAGTAGPVSDRSGLLRHGRLQPIGRNGGGRLRRGGLPASTATGTYNLSGGSLQAGQEDVGDAGTGTFTQLGGTNSVNGNVPAHQQ